MRIAFDIDGTIFNESGKKREEVINLMNSFSSLGWEIILHSGGGLNYAETILNRLKLVLPKGITPKAKGEHYDIAVDDIEYKNCDYLIKV